MADPNAVTHTIRLKSGANGFSELLDGTETGLVTYLGLNIYGFIMPEEDVHLRMLFLRKENPFLDVNETQLFYTPVLWAVGEGITAGISATAKTSDNNQAVTATSGNPGVARVELTKVYNGYDCRFAVKFNGVGAATITITSEDGNVSKHYTIIVYDSYETPHRPTAHSGAVRYLNERHPGGERCQDQHHDGLAYDDTERQRSDWRQRPSDCRKLYP